MTWGLLGYHSEEGGTCSGSKNTLLTFLLFGPGCEMGMFAAGRSLFRNGGGTQHIQLCREEQVRFAGSGTRVPGRNSVGVGGSSWKAGGMQRGCWETGTAPSMCSACQTRTGRGSWCRAFPARIPCAGGAGAEEALRVPRRD